MRDQTTCHLSLDPADPGDAPSNRKKIIIKHFTQGGDWTGLPLWQMHKDLQINTLLVVEGDNATMSLTQGCDLGQPAVNHGFNSANDQNLSVSSMAFNLAGSCQRSQSEDAEIGWPACFSCCFDFDEKRDEREEGRIDWVSCFLSSRRGNTDWAGVWEH